MEHLNCPSEALWTERQKWFENEIEIAMGDGLAGYMLSEQATALTADLEAVFCAGAWVAAVILSAAIVEAQLREEMQTVKANAKKIIDVVTGGDPDLHWLRLRRNALVHADCNNPSITVDQQWSDRTALETDAKKAITLVFKVLFMSPFV